MTPTGTHVALLVIGAFYVAGGFLAARAALTSRLIDRAIAAIAMERVDVRETRRTAWLLSAAVLILAGGAALLILSQLAAPLFIASAAGQAAYIYVAAPRYFDQADPPEAAGRRGTRNAFFLYIVATAFVVLCAVEGSLFPLTETSTIAWVAFLGIVGAHVVYILRAMSAPPAKRKTTRPNASDEPEAHVEQPPLDPASVKAVLVMTDYQTGPLFLDDDRSDPIDTDFLEMSAELRTALDTWARAYDMSFNHDDYTKPLWTDEQYAAHAEAGRRLAEQLALERPDLRVRFWGDGRRYDISPGR